MRVNVPNTIKANLKTRTQNKAVTQITHAKSQIQNSFYAHMKFNQSVFMGEKCPYCQ